MRSGTKATSDADGARLGIRGGMRALVLAGVGFHFAYVALHLVHVSRRDPAFLSYLSPIPLFGTVASSACCAVVLGALGLAAPRDEWRVAPSRLLAAAIALFVVVIALWP